MFWRPKKIEGIRLGTGVHMDHLGRIIDIAIPDSDRRRHTFVFGTTGVGKTRLAELMIEQDIRAGKSVVFFDPKGDQQIFTKIFDVARGCGREEDMMLVTPVFPEYSAVVVMPDELVGHVISGIQGGGESPSSATSPRRSPQP